jgi:hypothetical protein
VQFYAHELFDVESQQDLLAMEDIVKDTTDNHALKEFGRCIKEDMRKCAE